VRQELNNQAASVTSAIYGAGFNSNGRFYESVGEMLGMTPSDYRSGGNNAEIHFAIGECSLGSILVARSERGVCAILLGDDPDILARDLQDRFPRARLIGGDAGFEALVAQVVGFVEAPSMGLDLPLDVRGTAFQQRVWQVLRQVPAGSTVSYAEVARRIGAPGSARAVAQACGANAIAVAIPATGSCGMMARSPAIVGAWSASTPCCGRRARNECPDLRAGRACRLGAMAAELDQQGAAVLPGLLSAEECRGIAALYAEEEHFRSHIIMARHGFGKGEYRYFRYPLPDPPALRTALYARLAPVANRWNERMGIETRYPAGACRLSDAVPPGRADAADTLAAAIRCGRL
jgi:O-6-methylguanine DNA methyltransferase